MQLELQGSEEEIASLQKELQAQFPDQQLEFSTAQPAAPRFGARAPMGEAVLVTVLLTAAATTLTNEMVKDLYKLIKQKYLGVQVKPVS